METYEPAMESITFLCPRGAYRMNRSPAWLDVRSDGLAKALARYEFTMRGGAFEANMKVLCRWYVDFVEDAWRDLQAACRAYANGYRDPSRDAHAGKENARLSRARDAAHAAYRGRVRKAAAKSKALRRLSSVSDALDVLDGFLEEHIERVERLQGEMNGKGKV